MDRTSCQWIKIINTLTGPSRCHTSLFKKIRSARIDSFVAETNKLLIRLDKLLRDIPSDPVKRKAHERSIVMWAEDKDVPLCPFCARTFNLARRRHHCRLCGGIMCDECSEFLTFDYAKKLVSPVHQGNVNQMTTVATSSSSSSGGPLMTSFLAGISGLRRSGSQGSLNSLLSVMDSMTSEQHFRVCRHCMMRLQARDNQVEQRTSKPTLSLYYEKLMEYRALLERLLPQYIQMAESLNAGETTYNLQDAEGCSTPLGSGQELLQRRIFSTSSGFLKAHILSLPKLPTFPGAKGDSGGEKALVGHLGVLEAKQGWQLKGSYAAGRGGEQVRSCDVGTRREKDSPRKTPNRSSSSNTPSRSSSGTPVSFSTSRKKQSDEVVVDTGWGPNLSPPCVTETDDPMIQQMNNLRNYIRQAREANRYDAVATLEANLKELQGEYKKQQRLMNP
ncbi:rabenosyn-5-like [Penaeus monodon]|uniref:rabenosyn-5-like n=1 Tax=Penaeus monodon TaxID=6687 RepID=UPI0018A6ECAC|nr:rabenosyn-5-like [Penaeus monodon]